MHDRMAATQVAFASLLGHHGAVTRTGILVVGTMVAHLVVVITGMVLDSGTLLVALVGEMGKTAENCVMKESLTVAVMVAAVSLVVLRVANRLVLQQGAARKEQRRFIRCQPWACGPCA